MQNLYKAAFVLGFGALGTTFGSAQVRSITVPNGSFEVPNPFAQNAQTVPDFNQPGSVNDWIFQCDSNAGNNSRDQPSFPNSFGALPGGEGAAVAFFNNPVGGQEARAYSQVLGELIQPNTLYTMTVALGNIAGTGDYQNPGNYTLQILSDFHAIAAQSPQIVGSAIPDGTLVDYSVTLTTGDTGVDPLVGHALLLQVTENSTGANQQSSFDNVRLTAVSVPEPMSLTVLGLGGLMALHRRRA